MASRTGATPERFAGFPKELYDFWDGLDEDNSREFFLAHKDQWQRSVRGPLDALLAELRTEFGDAHVFRMNRDVRFANDKRPYKDHQGAVIDDHHGSGARYLHVDGSGLFVGAGYYVMGSDQLARFRAAVADERTGTELVTLLDACRKAGLDVAAPDLVRVPKPWDTGHPRQSLLRNKRMFVSRTWQQPAWLHRRDALTKVRDTWQAAAPVCAWLTDHVGPSSLPSRH